MLRRHSQVVRQRSAKPPSPGSNPGVAFVNIPSFSALEAPSSFNGPNFNLFHFSPNHVESTHEFRPNLVQVFATFWEVTTDILKAIVFDNWGKTGVNYHGY
jgi:hypothetical protein